MQSGFRITAEEAYTTIWDNNNLPVITGEQVIRNRRGFVFEEGGPCPLVSVSVQQ